MASPTSLGPEARLLRKLFKILSHKIQNFYFWVLNTIIILYSSSEKKTQKLMGNAKIYDFCAIVTLISSFFGHQGLFFFSKKRNSQKHSFSRLVRSMVRWGIAPVYVFPILFGWAKSRGSVTVRPWFGLERPPCGEN